MSRAEKVALRARRVDVRELIVPLTAALVLICSSRTSAAESNATDSRPVGFPQYVMLLSSPLVQEDVQLTDEQKAEIACLAKTYLKSAYQVHGHMLEMMNLPGLSQEDRVAVTEDMRMKLAKLSGECDQKALATLERSQHKRLAQLRLRVMGAEIVLEPRLRAQLGVSDTQLKRLKVAFQERNNACNEYLAKAKKENAPHQEMKARIDEIRTEAWHNMQKTLTATQKRKLREMLGPEPSFKPSEVKLRLSLKVR